ncbi:hypothetical protein [Rufibacter hautae]|uniref:Uncharacterized protein n=1 Tax=Rufibacter hautae TaxID=2595005 RepID=A0A5B6TCZ5_9BACT|nr:hypothetical protein [Rufibacter hautae]KAA3436894.1 hypothetical protein FOA19_21200 [Rufibacter hautae]
METRNTLLKVVAPILTFVAVKVVHNAVGFEYDLFVEGIFNLGFVIDIMSFAVGYAGFSYLLLRVFSRNTSE